jgi:hypothetical protein
MSILSTIQTAAPAAPPIILVHGPPGSRKTQLCVDTGGLLLLTEKGLGNRHAPHLVLSGLQMFYDTIKELGTTDHAFKTVCIDSLDHLVPLVQKKVCDENGKPNLRSFGYGKGEVAESEEWFTIFKYLETLVQKKGITVVMTAHSQVKVVDDPSLTEGYPRWEIKLPKAVGAVCREKCDIIGCVTPKVFVKDNDDGKTRALGDGSFHLHVCQKPSIDAKNRYGINQSPIDMSWSALWTAYTNTTKEIAK